ncbi:hypothetical protein [Actinomadura sp. 3N407]|uniref:hypothetical protein n=1 Tax=Actinomadura sp. 3N407 TaxID=3457423 RepID=UPI003FCD153B
MELSQLATDVGVRGGKASEAGVLSSPKAMWTSSGTVVSLTCVMPAWTRSAKCAVRVPPGRSALGFDRDFDPLDSPVIGDFERKAARPRHPIATGEGHPFLFSIAPIEADALCRMAGVSSPPDP